MDGTFFWDIVYQFKQEGKIAGFSNMIIYNGGEIVIDENIVQCSGISFINVIFHEKLELKNFAIEGLVSFKDCEFKKGLKISRVSFGKENLKNNVVPDAIITLKKIKTLPT